MYVAKFVTFVKTVWQFLVVLYFCWYVCIRLVWLLFYFLAGFWFLVIFGFVKARQFLNSENAFFRRERDIYIALVTTVWRIKKLYMISVDNCLSVATNLLLYCERLFLDTFRSFKFCVLIQFWSEHCLIFIVLGQFMSDFHSLGSDHGYHIYITSFIK